MQATLLQQRWAWWLPCPGRVPGLIKAQWGKIQVVAKARPLPGRSPEKSEGSSKGTSRALYALAQKRGQQVVTTKAGARTDFHLYEVASMYFICII